jgi:hypothetical protein
MLDGEEHRTDAIDQVIAEMLERELRRLGFRCQLEPLHQGEVPPTSKA